MDKRSFQQKLPEVLVVLLCMIVLCIGVYQKEGYHMDEILSFEMSNAAFNPWIVPTQPQGRLAKFVENELQGESAKETLQNLKNTVVDVINNRGNSKLLSYKADVYEEPVWIDAESYKEYITVGDADAFQYLSVYFNVRDDVHPIFHYLLLHSMSSLFRGMAEPFVGCVINLAAVAGVLLLLMRLGKRFAVLLGMEKRARLIGVFTALCYGLSTGAMATTLLVRMYAVLTFFCVVFFTIHVEKWLQQGFAKKNKGLIAVTALGFLTQYFFLFYCFLLAAFTAVMLLCKKRTKEFWCYVRSMVIAGVIGVAAFPFSISHVLTSDRGEQALGSLTQGVSDFLIRLQAFGSILLERTFGESLSLAMLVIGIIAGVVFVVRRKSQLPVWMLFLPAVGYFLFVAKVSPFLVDRYIMAVFPFVALMGALLLFWLADRIEQKISKKGIAYALCSCVVFCQVWNLIQYDGSYQYKGYDIQRQISQEYAQYPCICVYDSVGYYENILEFTNYEKTLLLLEGELADRVETESVTELGQFVLLLKDNVDAENVFAIMEEKYGFVTEQILLEQSVHGDMIVLMSRL